MSDVKLDPAELTVEMASYATDDNTADAALARDMIDEERPLTA